MAEILETKRRELPWAQLGQYAAAPFAQQQQQQQSLYQALLPVIFKAQMEKAAKLDELGLRATYAAKVRKELEEGGNGKLGTWKYKLDEWGMPTEYSQQSVKEQLDDILANRRMRAMGGETQPSVPQQITDVVPRQPQSSQIPQVVSDVMGGLPPQRIANPDYPYEDRPTIENPLFKSALEQQTKIREAIRKEESDAGSALALFDSLEKDWLETNPSKITNNGKFSPVGTFIKGPLQPFYGVEQRIGSEFQITKNQRADRKYVRRVNALQSRLAKGSIGIDVGNLSTYEQAAAKGGVAGLSDSFEVGIEMFQSAKDLIRDMKQARIEGYKSLDEKLKAEGRFLTSDKAQEYLIKAGGDKEKARQMAIKDRWVF